MNGGTEKIEDKKKFDLPSFVVFSTSFLRLYTATVELDCTHAGPIVKYIFN